MQATVAVLEYHLTGYARIWRSTVFSSLTMPVLYLLGIGAVVGQYVDRTAALAAPYVQFVAPGILGFTALKVALDESTFPVLTSFQYQKTYFAMAAAPVRVIDMVLGRLGYIAVRICVASTAFLAVALAVGAIRSWLGVVSIGVAVLAGTAIAAPGLAGAASVRTPGLMAGVVRNGWVPITPFFGRVFTL